MHEKFSRDRRRSFLNQRGTQRASVTTRWQECVDFRGADEVVFRQAADGMCRVTNAALAETDFEIGVVVLLVRDPRCRVHEGDRLVVVPEPVSSCRKGYPRQVRLPV